MKANTFVFLLLFLAFWSIDQTQAQNYSSYLLSDQLKENAHTVLRQYSIDYQVNSPKNAIETRHIVATILNNESDYNELNVHYDDLTLIKSIEGKLYDANGQLVRKLKKSEIKDIARLDGISIYTDNRIKVAELNYHQYPYTVEYQYTVEHKGIRFYPLWMPQREYEVSVEKSSYQISMPNDIKLHFKEKNLASTAKIADNENRTNYTWQLADLPAVEWEPFSPPYYEFLPVVYTAPEKFEMSGYKGSMDDWKTLGQFTYELSKGRGKLSDKTKAKVRDIIKSTDNKQDKIKLLYQYLQENTRYVSVQLGIGGWQTFPASYVEANQYGDCKALSNYMQSLLNEADIEAYPALTWAGKWPPDIQEDFAMDRFNHVILYVPDDEEPTWLECTSTYNPPNYLGASNENRKVLLVKPDDSQLISAPTSEAKQNKQEQIITVKLKETGEAYLEVRQTSTGSQQQTLRYKANKESKEDQEKWLLQNLELNGASLNNFSIKSFPDEPKATLLVDLEVAKYASTSGNRLFFKPNILNQNQEVPKELEERKLPIYNNTTYLDTDRVTFNIPKGYRVESLPKERIKLDTEFGLYVSEVLQDGESIVYKRRLEARTFELPKEKYEDLRAFWKAVVKADRVKVVLVRE